MPPVFKKVKEYDPNLAHRTLEPERNKDDEAARQMMRELGLDDGELDSNNGRERTTGEGASSTWLAGALKKGFSTQQSGGIPAYFPPASDAGISKGPDKMVEQLRVRLEASLAKLHSGQVTGSGTEEVEELLHDQQHQIELLVKGNFSLRGSMSGLRRNSKEIESRSRQLQDELEQQHQAALRQMETKLEMAIQQVQLLQQANRERQQQQEANAQLALSAATWEVQSLKTRLDDLQALLQSKEHELNNARQRSDHLNAQVAKLSQASSKLDQVSNQLEQERVQHKEYDKSIQQQLQQLAVECQARQDEVHGKAAALQQVDLRMTQVTQQLSSFTAANKDLQARYDNICQQLEEAKASSKAQASASSARAAAEVQQMQDKCNDLSQQLEEAQAQNKDLQSKFDSLRQQLEHTKQSTQHEAALSSARAASELKQVADRCTKLCQELEQAQAEKQAIQSALLDLTIQHENLQSSKGQLQQQLDEALKVQSELQSSCQLLVAAKDELQLQCQQATQELASAAKRDTASEQHQQELVTRQNEMQLQLNQLEADNASLMEQLQESQHCCAAAAADVQQLTQQEQELKEKAGTMETENQQLHWRMSSMQAEHAKVQRAAAEQVQQLQQDISNALQQLADAEAATEQRIAIVQAAAAKDIELQRQKWREEFLKRRKLHNLVVELKGNIRVLARIRPHNDTEKARAGADTVESAVRTVNEETILLAGNVTKEFEFDRVFGPSDGQQQVYEEVSSLVTSIMDGFNVCIMAYGQTGSGKTYTIEGPADNPGVNSRALEEVFAVAEERADDVSYSFSASVLEIYNEQIFDLLAGSRDTSDKLDVKEGSNGLFIPGLRVEPVHNLDDVAAVLQKGKQNRSTFATNMNEHSSRSHLVLSLYVKAEDLIKGTSWSSKLHLIDLAGSERVSRSGAEGERLKEAAAINKSLSALGDVLAALQQRNSHIPYRNSKLTRLLEDSLGGNSKMLMVVNCSPAVENVPETKCSLEFAARARKVELGAASRNAESPTVASPAVSPLRASMASLTVGGLGSGANSVSSSPRSTISRPQSADVSSTSRLAASRRTTGLQQ